MSHGSRQPLLAEHFLPTVQRVDILPGTVEEEWCSEGTHAFQLSYERGKLYTWRIYRKAEDFQELHSQLQEFDSQPSLHLSTDPESRLINFEDYLRSLIQVPTLRLSPPFLHFIEVSTLSFHSKSEKWKEGFVFKRTGGYLASEHICCDLYKYLSRFQKRWLVLRDESLSYLVRPEQRNLREHLSFRRGLRVVCGADTGYEDGVMVESSTRRFYFRAGTVEAAKEWNFQINLAYSRSEWSRGEFRYRSSFPVRSGNLAKWYVDGEDYFRDVCDALLAAKDAVFITDWWLSPELSLKRPGANSKVMDVLRTLAERKVKVCIHVYKEVSFALALNSAHTKKTLQECGARVIRHPHRSVVGSQFLWSHHEKMVIIDSSQAFIGGLDLCFGRWDTNQHPLIDYSGEVWPGIDYSNCRVADFSNVEEWEVDSIEREQVPRMPWHDIAVMVKGPVANDIALRFTELWNFVMSDFTQHYRNNKELLQPSMPQTRRSSSVRSFRRPNNTVVQTAPAKPSKIDLTALENVEMRTKVTRAVPTAKVLPHSFNTESDEIYRENLLTRQASTIRSFRAPQPSFTRSEDAEIAEETKEAAELREDQLQGEEQFARQLLAHDEKRQDQVGRCEAQLVVSCGLWSYGSATEMSIFSAYLHLIGEADHFIYIENQFFISSTAGEPVQNTIAEALVERIKVAHKEGAAFKVMVVMPLLPAFEGSVEDQAAKVLRVQLHWEYATISRSPNSLFARLRKAGIERPEDYIGFYGLRTHALMDRPVTEIVYVHSKLMITDDKYALIGSANINDRSMVGDRDSEVAVKGQIDGNPGLRRNRLHSRRKKRESVDIRAFPSYPHISRTAGRSGFRAAQRPTESCLHCAPPSPSGRKCQSDQHSTVSRLIRVLPR